MGKKNKSFKEKLYSIPRSKILVVLNPWGSHGHPTFANNVGGWFERMLQDKYPGKCINMIFTRPGDTVTLIELPEDINVAPLLGAHHYCNFLIPPYNTSNLVSYIYEYNYIKKGPPERQNCWKPAFPSYESLRSDFAVKFPYPAPSPAPNPPDSLGNLAQPLLPHLLRRPSVSHPMPVHPSRDVPATSNPTPGSSTHLPKLNPSPEHVKDVKQLEIQNTFESYTSPLNLTKVHNREPEKVKPEIKQEERRTVIGKRDPYEAEEAAAVMLRVKDSTNPVPVKNEPSVDNVGKFLHSIIGGVKKEEPVAHHVPPPLSAYRRPELKHDDYEPSSDLLKLFSTLPSDLVSGVTPDPPKLDPAKAENSVAEYRPSEELLATFATLPPEFLSGGGVGKQTKQIIKVEEPPIKIRVKPEPIDDDIKLGGWETESIPTDRARSMTLATDSGTAEPQSRPPPVVRVKAEPQENSNLFMPPPTRDPRKRPQPALSTYNREEPLVNLSKTQDPRTRPATSRKHELEAEPVDTPPNVTKRIKLEWD
ncbi:hypothetical protein BDZ94DRAFT_1320529 [Collybia nuda]|uniref:Uncharacterized protein n=1 Tax=Collybia nuda TaxID=64659 RepID=A0A9P5YB78_9AGAR|nr:hypothetical protein BDZ94DRAFT_1320529 [Collybia nuda]